MISRQYQDVPHVVDRQVSASAFGAWLIALSYLTFCISDMMLSVQDDRSVVVKLAAFGLLGMSVALRPRFHKYILLIGPLIVVLMIGLIRSFNLVAGIDELQRFIFPIAITIALYAYRDRLRVVVLMFFFVVVTNDIFQCYFYAAYILKLPLLLPVRIDSGLYLRAQGWIGFFSEFGFMNFCALLLLTLGKNRKRTGLWKYCIVIFSILSFSFKLFVVLLAYPVVLKTIRGKAYILALAGIALVVFAFTLGFFDQILALAESKISFYIVAGNSARAESYRVMWESLIRGNFLGEGLGSFGGPASVKYNSPLYSYYHFNWYGMQDILKTTDTFYPHLFVELGLLGGVLWLFIVVMYGQRYVTNRIWIYVVAAFLFDNAFSLAILSPSYVFPALLVMYWISEQKERSNSRMPVSLAGRASR
ncbi:hypothetical protein [Paraburkholderia acidipaludis]|uniref:hypothetical protein n=1 Tax=Paraburkholderia acidipaludis TaxID=660537 RepID=UPI0005BC23AE|nr:hypothetical protein [Paraburkholderia acidipaludis]